MNILKRQPDNTNFLIPTQFRLVFSQLIHVEFFCQSVKIPAVSINHTPFATPFSTIKTPGDKLIYDPLEFSFAVDEDLKSWNEIYAWIRGLGFPTSFNEYKKQKVKGIYVDATAYLLTSAHTPNTQIVYKNVFPTMLSSLYMDSSSDGKDILKASATFAYDYFDIKPRVSIATENIRQNII